MKLYKEMLRKTAVIGIPLMLVTLIYTLVDGAQDCFGLNYATVSSSAISLLPVLRYYVFSAAVFALYGYSFLFSRKASDIYHSLPVKRSRLYLSVFYATISWMTVTIVLNALLILAILLISGCPFVPLYIPLCILFYVVASVLVFAAAAIGCALSGTWITAVVSTGIILCLPRFVQYLFARGIVERVSIVGWLDFGVLLSPITNIATGLVVMTRQNVFMYRIINLPNTLYSAALAALMLGIGLWCFLRRPSEMAQRNRGNKVWNIVSAVLLSFVVMLPITMGGRSWFSVYGGVLCVAAFSVFVVYQLIVTLNIKDTLKTLPFFVLSLCLALSTALLIETTADTMLNTTPDAEEIESVVFLGYDDDTATPVYTTLMTDDIEFTDAEIITYVSLALEEAVEELNDYFGVLDYEYNENEVIESIVIQLKNGKTIRRTIEFDDVDELNSLRMENESYWEAVLTFPSLDSVQYLYVDQRFTQEENEAILASYIAEATAEQIPNGYYYRMRAGTKRSDGTEVTQGTDQTITSITSYGYVGTERYNDYYSLRLELPETISLLMQTYNSYADDDLFGELNEKILMYENGEMPEDDSMSVNITTFNYPDDEGYLVTESYSFYLNSSILESSYAYDQLQLEYGLQLIKLLSKATLTDDPDGLFIRMYWYYNDDDVSQTYTERKRPTVFLAFEEEEDEQAFLDLMEEWISAEYSYYY